MSKPRLESPAVRFYLTCQKKLAPKFCNGQVKPDNLLGAHKIPAQNLMVIGAGL